MTSAPTTLSPAYQLANHLRNYPNEATMWKSYGPPFLELLWWTLHFLYQNPRPLIVISKVLHYQKPFQPLFPSLTSNIQSGPTKMNYFLHKLSAPSIAQPFPHYSLPSFLPNELSFSPVYVSSPTTSHTTFHSCRVNCSLFCAPT